MERATRTLHAYEINGVRVLAYDQQGSVAADRVADELAADTYGLGAIPFRPGDTVIDIGAHVGLVSLYLAKRWPLLHIHAFEPYAVNHETCLENLRVNHVTNVRLYREAVTADARPIVLRCLPSNTGGATAVFAMPGADAAAAVRSTTLREVFERALEPGERCRLLKMDCEGMEYEILPSPVLDRVDFFAAEFHEDARGGGGQPSVGHGAAQALAERCARFLRPEQLRIVCCPKQD
jgi:FkbM family methyltransferase